MKIIIALDSFKGSLTAKEVATSIHTALKQIISSAEYVEIPMADGGEGTMQALVDTTKGATPEMVEKIYIILLPLHEEI